jgi:hypothetical protein
MAKPKNGEFGGQKSARSCGDKNVNCEFISMGAWLSACR